METYEELWTVYRNNPKQYWAKIAQKFTWFQKWHTVLNDSDPHSQKWFVGGTMNLSYDCLDRHVKAGFGNETAVIYDCFYTGKVVRVSFENLLNKVSRLAGFLLAAGVKPGDRALIFMPMIPEQLISTLSCCRVGVVYFNLSGVNTAAAIADRIDDFKPKVLFTVNESYVVNGHKPNRVMELVVQAVTLTTHKPTMYFVYQRPEFERFELREDRDYDFEKCVALGVPQDCIPLDANHPLFVLSTSGTTGKPKIIEHNVIGMAIACAQQGGQAPISRPGIINVAFMATTFGWIAGQVFLCYKPLLARVATIIYEGDMSALTATEAYRLLSEHKVDLAFFSISTLRLLKKEDWSGKIAELYKPFSVKHLCSGGGSADTATVEWATETFGLRVMQVYGLTEICGSTTIPSDHCAEGESEKNRSLMSSGKPFPGYFMKVLRDDGSEADVDEVGNLVLKLPLPPTMMTILHNRDTFVEYFKDFPGYFCCHDNAKISKEGHVFVLNRSDSVFKVAGHRVSCQSLEEVMMAHPDVSECIVVSASLNDEGVTKEIPFGFLTVKKDAENSKGQLAAELVERVQQIIGDFVPLKKLFVVDSFPRTHSGKVARFELQELVRNCVKKQAESIGVSGMQSIDLLWKAYRVSPKQYWAKLVKNFTWFRKWDTVLDDSNLYFPKWFVGGQMNLTYDCLDRHVKNGFGDETAIIYDSFYTKEVRRLSRVELLDKVSRLAGALVHQGVQPGDRALIYMPLIPENLISVLACCRIGVVYCNLAGADNEYIIAKRIDDFQPKVVFVVNEQYETNGTTTRNKTLVDRAVKLAAYKSIKCIVHQRPQFDQVQLIEQRDLNFDDCIALSEPQECIPVEVNHPLLVLYTSGTTGEPKGTVHSIIAMAVACVKIDGGLKVENSGSENIFMASSVGWIVGQISVIYAPLLAKRTTVIYEGDIICLPATEVYRLHSSYEVSVAFLTVPALRRIKKEDSTGKISESYKPFKLKCMVSGGGAPDMSTVEWVCEAFGAPLMQMYGLTEATGCVTVNIPWECEGQLSTTCGKPVPGYHLTVLRDDGTEADDEEAGNLVLKLPLSPAMMTTIYNDDDKFLDYFKDFQGYFNLHDLAKRSEDGNFFVLGRSDTVFKAARNRVNCCSMENVMLSHPDVAECLVVTHLWNDGDIVKEIPLGFFAIKEGAKKSTKEVAGDLIDLIRRNIGDFLEFSEPLPVASFPRNHSGKIARFKIQQMIRSYLKNPNAKLKDFSWEETD